MSKFILKRVLDTQLIIYEIDTQAIIKPLLGLQRHYNTIRHWMIQNDYKNPILSQKFEEEITQLWQLLAQAKAPVVQRDR